MRYKRVRAATGVAVLAATLLIRPMEVRADCYCNLTEPVDVMVQNWQTFRPKVTAMHSLNAYLANSKEVYYVPELADIKNVKNRMYNCTDYNGANYKFAAIYDGYFDVEVQDVLLKDSAGNYTKVPQMMKDVAKGSERELQILGYDYLLTKEAISDIRVYGNQISAEYNVNKIDLVNGSVDMQTAIMNIYKAVGQEVQDVTYIFAEDQGLTLETSPIQQEIHLQMAKDNSIDVSAGAGYVFVTRTNPELYWDKAQRDHVVVDTTNSDNSQRFDGKYNGTGTKTLTLAEFCAYAYEIMNIYGEPTMTTAEKSILLQTYGRSIPYNTVDGYAVEAIENFIAKGIISPDDDAANMNWNAPISPRYMLTILMRIADVNSRMTYKDVQITINPTLIDQHYYAAKISVDESSVVDLVEDSMYAKLATYISSEFSQSTVRNTFDAQDLSAFYIQNHLVVKRADKDEYLPLGVLVATETNLGENSVYTYEKWKEINAKTTSTTPFAECLGWNAGQEKLSINTYVRTVVDLRQSDDTYHIHLQLEDGTYSSGYLRIQPGKADVSASSSRDDWEDDDDDWYEDDEDDWDDEEEEEDDYWNEEGIDLASSQTAVVIMTIEPGSESNITFMSSDKSVRKTLAEIMLDVKEDGYAYLVEGDPTDIHIKKITDTRYQVEGAENKEQLKDRIEQGESSISSAKSGFVQRDKELIVSTAWLKDAGFILRADVDDKNKDIMCIKSRLNEIYLDRSRKIVVAGTTIFTLYDLTEDEIFYENNDGEFYVNFRAVLGWTGDFMMFKNDENGVVKVTVKGYPKELSSSRNSVTDTGGIQLVQFKYINTDNTPFAGAPFNSVDLSQYVQGSNSQLRVDSRCGKYSISMTSTYPFANWFIYSRGNLTQEEGTDKDWLYVFKPRKIQVDGQMMEYNDNDAREQLKTLLGEDYKFSNEDISVWCYSLDKTEEGANSNPKGFVWDESYGWTYTPQKVNSLSEFLKGYTDGTTTFKGTNAGTPAENVLPIIVANNTVNDAMMYCVNFNSYSLADGNSQEFFLDYGTLPAASLQSYMGTDNPMGNWLINQATSATNLIFQLTGLNLNPRDVLRKNWYALPDTNSGLMLLKEKDADSPDLNNYKVYPTIVSPSLWVMELAEYGYDDIAQLNSNSVKMLSGTDLIEFRRNAAGEIQIWQGGKELSVDEFRDRRFLRIRDYETTNGTREYIFSESQLESFTLNTGNGDSFADRTMDVFGVGRASTHIDVIDWDEFTLERLLEDFEFGVAITMVVVLYIIPRICLFVFLILLALGVVQNVKVVQWFCDRVFDPYKFLTMGRRNVHTFRPGVAFRNSIIAMAVFALFMDGTIIHFFEWVVQFIAYIAGN